MTPVDDTAARTPKAREQATTDHVARRIREARASLQLEQGKLAERVGVVQVTVCHWEKGERRVSIAQLRDLAAALEKPLGYFLDFPAGRDEAGREAAEEARAEL